MKGIHIFQKVIPNLWQNALPVVGGSNILLIGFFPLIIGISIALLLRKRTFGIMFWSFFYIYIIMVLGLTLFPLPYQEVESMYPAPNNLIPFQSIGSMLQRGISYTALVQIGGNVMIAIPYGLLLYILSCKKGIQRLLAALGFPLTIELLQLLVGKIIGLNYRSFDIDDILLNTIGVYVGILCGYMILKPWKERILAGLFTKRTQSKSSEERDHSASET